MSSTQEENESIQEALIALAKKRDRPTFKDVCKTVTHELSIYRNEREIGILALQAAAKAYIKFPEGGATCARRLYDACGVPWRYFRTPEIDKTNPDEHERNLALHSDSVLT